MVIENNKKKEKIKILKNNKNAERQVAWVFETKNPTARPIPAPESAAIIYWYLVNGRGQLIDKNTARWIDI